MQGMIDIDAELATLADQRNRLVESASKLTALTATSGYKEKVPEAVQAANTQKLAELQAQVVEVSNIMLPYEFAFCCLTTKIAAVDAATKDLQALKA